MIITSLVEWTVSCPLYDLRLRVFDEGWQVEAGADVGEVADEADEEVV
jgi:hypothetical protein